MSHRENSVPNILKSIISAFKLPKKLHLVPDNVTNGADFTDFVVPAVLLDPDARVHSDLPRSPQQVKRRNSQKKPINLNQMKFTT